MARLDLSDQCQVVTCHHVEEYEYEGYPLLHVRPKLFHVRTTHVVV